MEPQPRKERMSPSSSRQPPSPPKRSPLPEGNRSKLIDATGLLELLRDGQNSLGGTPQGVGGVADHVHLLIGLKPTHRLSDFMREVKKASSVWTSESEQVSELGWQEGYAAFTVSASAKAAVQACIACQEEHRHRLSFREELVEFLQKSGVDHDERYLD